MRSGCDVAAPRTVLDRIVKDEPRHSSFWWDLLDWLLDGPCEGREESVRKLLPSGFGGLELAYGEATGSPATPDFPNGDRAGGLAPRYEYATVLESTFDRIWRPRFDAYGIDSVQAWQARASVA